MGSATVKLKFEIVSWYFIKKGVRSLFQFLIFSSDEIIFLSHPLRRVSWLFSRSINMKKQLVVHTIF